MIAGIMGFISTAFLLINIPWKTWLMFLEWCNTGLATYSSYAFFKSKKFNPQDRNSLLPHITIFAGTSIILVLELITGIKNSHSFYELALYLKSNPIFLISILISTLSSFFLLKKGKKPVRWILPVYLSVICVVLMTIVFFA